MATTPTSAPPPVEAEVTEILPPRGKAGDFRGSHGPRKGGSGGAARSVMDDLPEAMRGDPIIALIASLMDNAFRLPGTRIRFGLDPLLGLVPGVGDSVGSLVSIALIGMSARYGLPKIVLVRMALNTMINGVIGAIPFVGDAFSIWFKSNALNHRLLVEHAGKRRKSTMGDWLFVGGLILGVLGVIFLTLFGLFSLIALLLKT